MMPDIMSVKLWTLAMMQHFGTYKNTGRSDGTVFETLIWLYVEKGNASAKLSTVVE